MADYTPKAYICTALKLLEIPESSFGRLVNVRVSVVGTEVLRIVPG